MIEINKDEEIKMYEPKILKKFVKEEKKKWLEIQCENLIPLYPSIQTLQSINSCKGIYY